MYSAGRELRYDRCLGQRRYRRLTPVELERLNGFPDNHTEGATAARRAFLMGNALIVGVVEDLGRSLVRKIAECDGVR